MTKEQTHQVNSMTNIELFEDEHPPYLSVSEELLLDISGYEGPIDVLLTLARDQKVDLIKISILELAEQFLDFIAKARKLRVELAADYLVMAAWLAYLKSRLLLPLKDDENDVDGAEMAARLAFQLQRLEAMRRVSQKLFDRPQIGQDFYPRGLPENMPVERYSKFNLSLYDLLSVYGAFQQRKSASVLQIDPTKLFSIEGALVRLRRLVESVPDWTELAEFFPDDVGHSLIYRSAIAATLVASLELARTREITIRQSGEFKPIFIKTFRTDG